MVSGPSLLSSSPGPTAPTGVSYRLPLGTCHSMSHTFCRKTAAPVSIWLVKLGSLDSLGAGAVCLLPHCLGQVIVFSFLTREMAAFIV